MKNKIILFAAFGLLVTSCQPKSTSLKILCPTGAPAVAFYSFANDDNFETTSDPQTAIIPSFQLNDYDVLVAPTQGGLNQIVNQHANYQIAATITFGNFYLLSSQNDMNNQLDDGDKVLVFNENDVPGRIFKYCYGDLGLQVTYTSSVDLTKRAISEDFMYDGVKFDYIYTAEPVVTVTNSKDKIFEKVSDRFFEKSHCLLTQASIFINKNANKTKVNEFLTMLENDIVVGLNSPEIIKNKLNEYGSSIKQQAKFGLNGDVAYKVCLNNGLSLGYRKAFELKSDLEAFMSLFPQLNIGELNEEVFYK